MCALNPNFQRIIAYTVPRFVTPWLLSMRSSKIRMGFTNHRLPENEQWTWNWTNKRSNIVKSDLKCGKIFSWSSQGYRSSLNISYDYRNFSYRFVSHYSFNNHRFNLIIWFIIFVFTGEATFLIILYKINKINNSSKLLNL